MHEISISICLKSSTLAAWLGRTLWRCGVFPDVCGGGDAFSHTHRKDENKELQAQIDELREKHIRNFDAQYDRLCAEIEDKKQKNHLLEEQLRKMYVFKSPPPLSLTEQQSLCWVEARHC
mgnify:CR=1 FL=1